MIARMFRYSPGGRPRPGMDSRHEEDAMPAPAVLAEFRAAWLPHVSDAGLERLTDLLATANPLLIHGAFTRCLPMGCLASHIAWHHPETEHLQLEAGVTWLTR